MDKRQFLVEAIQAKKHLKKAWVIGLFAMTGDRDYNPDMHGPYDIVKKSSDEKILYTILPDNPTELVPLTGTNLKSPPFSPREGINLEPGMLPNLYEKVYTSVGTMLTNAQVLCWSFHNKVPYINGRWDGGDVDKLIASRLVDYPKGFVIPDDVADIKYADLHGPNDDPLTAPIYVHELLRYFKAVSNLAGYTQVVTPAASAKSLTVDPAIIKRRDELLNEYRDQLTDPAIVAKIMAELSAMDKASFKGDPAAGFLNISGKSFDVVRMKTYIMYGLEYGFSASGELPAFIPTSLAEGMDLNSFPAQVDGIRSGSYSRGKQTALGGYGVKEIYRILQNAMVADEPCNTKVGLPFLITQDNVKHLAGRYAIDKATGKSFLIEAKLLKANIGKSILVRSPGFCTAPGLTYCPYCIGEAYSRSKTGLHAAGADVLSVIMYDFMKAMHGKKLSTARYNFNNSLS